MPRGRFISKDICLDKQVNDLSSAESKLAFTWMITHLDKEGRTYGDPAIVRSMIFPRRTDISINKMETFIQEWHDAGLIIWYEYEGDKYILFPNFDKHQVGLNKSREADSVIPLPDELLTLSDISPDELPVKLKDKFKVKLIKGKVEVEVSDDNNSTNLITTFESYTSLKAGNGAKKIAVALIKAGVIEPDIINAIEFLNHSTQHKCVSFKSIRNPAIIEMDKRNKKPINKENPNRYTEGEYGEVGVR